MSSRSDFSQKKDKFNFALMLAHDLKIFITLDCIELTPQERLELLAIYLRTIARCSINAEDLQTIERLLGESKFTRLKTNAINKARLETDLSNTAED